VYVKLAVLVFWDIRRVNSKEGERNVEGGVQKLERRHNKLTLPSSLPSEGNNAQAI
jgi:transcription initiation factor TFIIIB Brf1 subunit/transcription initiation factor TFIIB